LGGCACWRQGGFCGVWCGRMLDWFLSCSLWGSAFRIMWVCDGSVCSAFSFLSFPCGGVFSSGSGCGFIYMVWVIYWCFVHVCACCQEAPLGWFPSWSLQAYHWDSLYSTGCLARIFMGWQWFLCIGGRIRHCSHVDRYGMLWCSCTVRSPWSW